ncbi:glycosyltransferase family 4 protein [Methanococcoides sp. SA1]|nr:glycosyltransferase family 4 protein [Methanococcoides sp. SA1]
MRILIISQHFPPERSGNASRIFDMSRHLQISGEDVTVLSPHPNFPHGSFKRKWSLSESKKVDDINLVNLLAWQPNGKDPGFVGRMAYYLSFPMHTILWILFHHRRFDVIITSAPPIFTGFGGLFSKIIFRKKWVMDVRDLWINASISLGFLKEGSFFEKISRMYEQVCYSRADLISGTTQELGEDIVRTYRDIDPAKVKVTPNGVDIDLFYPVNVPKKNQMIYAGNIGHAQDLENVILSLKKINEKFDMKLIIAGDGDIKEDLMKVTSENDLDELVDFPGMVNRELIPKMFSESLIGLAPLKKLKTLEYAVPTKAYECMACGIPFVGCGEGEIRKLAERSGGGVIAGNSADEIANTILSLLEDPLKMDEMGIKGRTFVEKNYSRKQIAAGLKENLHNIGNEKMNIEHSGGTRHAESE